MARMNIVRFCCAAGVLGFALNACAATEAIESWETETGQLPARPTDGSVTAPTNMTLFLLIGQSNMAGRAPVKAEDRVPVPRAYALDRDDKWTPAAAPLHYDRKNAGVGPADGFVRAYLAAHPGETVGLVPCAVGGSGMITWVPEGTGKAGANFRRALARAKVAQANGRFAGILWHQGETDAARPDADARLACYADRFAAMVARLRAELNDPELPVVTGEIGRFIKPRKDGRSVPDLFNPIVRALPARVAQCVCVSSEGLCALKDDLHFNRDAALELGRRYHEAYAQLRKGAGCVYQTGDWTLGVRDARTQADFEIARPDFVNVKDEAMVLKTKDPAVYPWSRALREKSNDPLHWGWVAGTRLAAIKAFECTTRFALVPESLRLRKADGTPLEEGKDFESERTWGAVARLATGRIGSNETVYADYTYAKQRIDRIVKRADGTFALRRGEPAASYPIPPATASGETSVATVWTDAQTKKLEDRNVFPTCETAYPQPSYAPGAHPAEKLLPKTLAKLRGGGHVRVLAWGDSVTDGGYLPERDRWQFQFTERLRARYPKAKIELVSCGWGGRSSDSFLSAGAGHPFNYREKVLGAKADLCVMEFVNDCGKSREAVFKSYGGILADFRAQGTEWCILTPHYTRADWMGLASQKRCDDDPRPYVHAVRTFCAEKGVALADASRIWGRLWRQGIPYKTLLVNDINHPNAQGMGYFADALMALFP